MGAVHCLAACCSDEISFEGSEWPMSETCADHVNVNVIFVYFGDCIQQSRLVFVGEIFAGGGRGQCCGWILSPKWSQTLIVGFRRTYAELLVKTRSSLWASITKDSHLERRFIEDIPHHIEFQNPGPYTVS
jgi:hypothetical protein